MYSTQGIVTNVTITFEMLTLKKKLKMTEIFLQTYHWIKRLITFFICLKHELFKLLKVTENIKEKQPIA